MKLLKPRSKIVEAEEALSGIRDGSVIAISGFNMATTPEHLILELYRLYEETGHPRNLFIISDTLPAVPGRALDKVAEMLYKDPGQKFLRGVLMPFLGWSPWLQKLVVEERIEAYSWSIGIAAYWFREIASGRPGLLTKIGLGTFMDPRQDCGALNEMSRYRRSCRTSILYIEGEEYLFYQAPKPDVGLIRGTTADEDGNISMEEEGILGTVLNIAQAVKALPKKGLVVAQVKWLTRSGSINPRCVVVPGPLVDYVVVAPRERHWQSGSFEYDPRLCYNVTPPITKELLETLPRPRKPRDRVIAAKTLLELMRIAAQHRRPIIVNLGIGIPTYVSSIAAEIGVQEYLVTTIESGPWGGVALVGQDFGLAISPFALISMPDMFSNYEGGIIDAASLGFLQVDKMGNVNPSMLPGRIFGPGGFPVIAGGSPRVFFTGGFTAGPYNIHVRRGKLVIEEDGPIVKFVNKVYKVVFNGLQAVNQNKDVRFITERAVFRLTSEGLVLEEVAPGVDIDRDIIGKMEFEPKISPKLREMESVVFEKSFEPLRKYVYAMFQEGEE